MSSASNSSSRKADPTEAVCTRRATCRLCGSRDLTRVLSLAPTPPANAFVGPERRDEAQATFPLDVFLCEDCSHLQLLDVVDPRLLFEDYVYVSGTSPVFVDHFRRYAEDVASRVTDDEGALAFDIGSNDGTLLGFFKEHGMRVLGIDPARDIARTARDNGIDTLCEFFTPELARQIQAEYGPARIVTANNVFAHADDLSAIVEGVRTLLTPDGAFVFEVSYLADVYEKTLFDTIYHEHLCYHAVKPFEQFFAAQGMELFEARRVDSHGGSLRGFAQLHGGPRPIDSSVQSLIELERSLGLDRAETWRSFAARIDDLKESLSALLADLKGHGKSIAGYGAPAKATTLLHHFDLGDDVLDFIVDDSPLKQGLYTPGQHIPIVAPETLYERRPDFLLVLAWNFAEPIMANHAGYKDAGGHFIVPLPDVTVH